MNRAELRSTVLDALNRKDLTAAANSWITSATSRINTLLRHRMMLQHRELDISSNKFSVPLDFIEVESFKVGSDTATGYVTPGGNRGNLTYCPPSEITDMASSVYASDGARPMFYTTHGMEFELAPWRADTGNFKADLWYWSRVTLAPEDTATNFVLTNYPQLYQNYAMSYGHRFLLEKDAGDGYEALAVGEIQQINDAEDMAKTGRGPLIMRPTRRLGGRFS